MQNTFEQVNEIIDTLEIIVKSNAQVAQIEKDILLERTRKLYIQLMDLAVVADVAPVENVIVEEEPVAEEKTEEIKKQEELVEPVKVEPEIQQKHNALHSMENDMDLFFVEKEKKQEIPTPEQKPVEPKQEEPVVKEEPVIEKVVEEKVVEEPKVEEPQKQVVEVKVEKPVEEVKIEKPVEKQEAVSEPESLPSDEDDLLQFIPQNKPEPAPTPAPEKPISQVQPQRSLNDLFNEQKDHSLSAQYQHAKVVDLTKAISINDKFTFIKELFNNKGEEFSAAIQSLNQCSTIDAAFDCLESLKKKYYWDSTSTAYLSLCDLLRRKF